MHVRSLLLSFFPPVPFSFSPSLSFPPLWRPFQIQLGKHCEFVQRVRAAAKPGGQKVSGNSSACCVESLDPSCDSSVSVKL